MPVSEFKESVEQIVEMTAIAGGGSLGIAQKRIDLQDGMRHTLAAVDFMDDSVIIPQESNFAYEFFVSPYPIVPTAMNLAEQFVGRGPVGSSDEVLFKALGANIGSTTSFQRLPNDFLGTTPTATWYSPHLYLTVLLHTVEAPVDPTVEIAMSVYLAVNSKNVNDVEYSMGIISEYQEAQTKARMNQGRNIEGAIRLVGETFPAWRFGGIRAERMIKANSKAGWFLKGYTYQNEDTLTGTEVRGYIGQSRQMQAYDTAFGSDASDLGGIPDWIRFLEFSPVNFGDERAQYPPTVKDNNGNTEMI